MSEYLLDILRLSLPGLIAGVVSAVVIVKLSLRRFRKEQLWLRRYEAYTRLIEILDTGKQYTGLVEEKFFVQGFEGEDELKRVRARWEAQQPEYKRLQLLASVQLPRHAREALEEYEEQSQRARDAEDLMDAIDIDYEATTKCITILEEVARKDLGVS